MTNFKAVSEQLKKMEEAPIDPKELMFFIYENHEHFFLNYLDEDERYDFILSLLPMLERIATTFDRRKASLEQYLHFLIKHYKLSWKRETIKNLIKEELIEYEYKTSLSAGLLHEDEAFFDTDNSELNVDMPNRLKTMLPLLAYKASAYVTREQIQKIAQISKTSAEEMSRIISILNKRIESRMNNVKKIAQRKTASYLMRKRYCFEKQLLEDSQSPRYEAIAEKADMKQKCYEKSRLHKITTQIVTPSWLIAEVLGVSIHSIENKLRYIHKLFPDFFKKRTPLTE